MPLWNVVVAFCAQDLLWIELLAFCGYLIWTKPRTRVRLLFISAVALLVAYILDRIAGAAWYDTRPFVESGVAPLISYTADNGFPSDHMLLASTLAAIVTLRHPRISIVFWCAAIAVGLARILAGIHHPIDVVASFIIALVSTGIAYELIILRPIRRAQRGHRGSDTMER